MSEIVLNVGGTNYSGWTSVDVTISMETLSGVFNVSMTDNIGTSDKPLRQSPSVKPGQTCSVSINGETVITGYVDKVIPMITSTTHTIVIQGRDKTCDLVDCSMIQSTNQWKGLTIDKIITRICSPFGIPVTIDADAGAAFETFVVEQGSSCFEIIQKLCYMRQLLAISDGKGGLLLTTSGTDTAKTSLIEGFNIKEGQANYDFSERYKTYLCKGQKQGDDFSTPENNTQNAGQYEDSVVDRYRPLLIIAEGQASIADCTQRAKWEGAIRRGKSRKLLITVNGWTQDGSTLWGINKLVAVQSVLLGVGDTLMISQCQFRLDENGEITILTVTSPEAYTLNTTGIKTNQKSNPYIAG
jgi:prophage tail gpP-like protein